MPGLADVLTCRALDVAPRLLGSTLSHSDDQGKVTVRITEVEAYMGEADPASHAFKGPTPRNEVMFGKAGRLYVYLSYGAHWCCNVVTGTEGHPSAVLLRAGTVIEGVDLARRRRGAQVVDRALARGPGCLGQALGLSREHDGVDLLESHHLRLRAGEPIERERIASGPRVGVTLAHDFPWRFWVAGDATVSSYKPSPRAGLSRRSFYDESERAARREHEK